MTPWKSIIQLDPNCNRSVYLKISDAFIKAINVGIITSGQKLPSSRQIAEILDVNRKTAIHAIDELLAQGWIDILPNKGAFVKNNLPVKKPQPLNFEIKKKPIIKPKASGLKPLISINDGIPDYRLSLIEKLYKQAGSLSQTAIGKSVLGEFSPAGESYLRNVLCHYLRESRAIPCLPDQVIVTRGSQMAMNLAFQEILKDGGKIAVCELSYCTANETVLSLGGEIIKVAINETGIDLEHLHGLLQRYDIKAVYVTPHHQYPTTVTMPVANRIQLLNLANQYDFLIIEDDYDYDYHYSGSPILPIASIDQNDRVIYVGSFAKIFSPSVRIGYMIAHTSFVEKCLTHRLYIDRRGDPLLERSLAMLIEDNELDRSLKKAIPIYKRRRDLMTSFLSAELNEHISFDTPGGGMAVWVYFKKVKIDQLKSQLLKNGIDMTTEVYTTMNRNSRLGFSSHDEEELKVILEELANSIRKIS